MTELQQRLIELEEENSYLRDNIAQAEARGIKRCVEALEAEKKDNESQRFEASYADQPEVLGIEIAIETLKSLLPQNND